MYNYYIILILILFQNFYSLHSYNFVIKIDKLCNNLVCDDKKLHTLCRKEEISSDCKNYLPMKHNRRFLLLGHNGLRNKIAGRWKISNAKLLHWSRDLETMARMFIKRCQLTPDQCGFISVPELTVGQNLYVSRRPPENVNNYEQTYTFVIREWYREIGLNIRTFDDFKGTSKSILNFTNMIWPTTEFVGCSGARMFQGFAVACYYHPAADRSDFSVFNLGKPCSECSVDRPTCSRDFHALCGLDFFNKLEDFGQILEPNIYLIIFVINFWYFVLYENFM